MTEIVAWLVEIEDKTCIVFATIASKARWIAVRSWREAGYGTDGRWPSGITATRSPRHDTSPLRNEGRRAWSPSHVEDTI